MNGHSNVCTKAVFVRSLPRISEKYTCARIAVNVHTCVKSKAAIDHSQVPLIIKITPGSIQVRLFDLFVLYSSLINVRCKKGINDIINQTTSM